MDDKSNYFVTWWRRTIRRFCGNNKGAAAIEMALVAAPFFALIFATLESGLVRFSEFALEKKVAEAGRLLRTGQMKSTTSDHSDFKAAICNEVAPMFDCSKLVVDVRSFTDFKGLDEADLPSPITEGKTLRNLNNWNSGGESDVVVVRVFYEWSLLMPGVITQMDNLRDGKRLIAASISFRNEPFEALAQAN
ncbi:MAG: TadE/TadG family type IV pilus assembly protein [Hyphomicrobiales bacterium]